MKLDMFWLVFLFALIISFLITIFHRRNLE